MLRIHRGRILPNPKRGPENGKTLIGYWVNYAKEGDKILDTHLGQASVMQHNRFEFVGCIDKDYFDKQEGTI